jgi:hypothetical protein
VRRPKIAIFFGKLPSRAFATMVILMRPEELAANAMAREVLKILAAQNARILIEPGFPLGKLKREFISIQVGDGRRVGLAGNGFVSSPLQITRDVLDVLLRAKAIEQDGPEDCEHRVAFRPTESGLVVGSMMG